MIKVHKSSTRKKAQLKGFVEDTVEPKIIPYVETPTNEPTTTEMPVVPIEENYSEWKDADDDIQDIINQVCWFNIYRNKLKQNKLVIFLEHIVYINDFRF